MAKSYSGAQVWLYAGSNIGCLRVGDYIFFPFFALHSSGVLDGAGIKKPRVPRRKPVRSVAPLACRFMPIIVTKK